MPETSGVSYLFIQTPEVLMPETSGVSHIFTKTPEVLIPTFMRLLLITALFILSKTAYSQEDKITDQLLRQICNSIDSSKSENDSIKVMQAFEKHLMPVIKDMNQTQAQEAWEKTLIRLQRTCYSFKKILDKMEPGTQSDWKEVDSKPSPSADKSVCLEFAKRKSFTYLELSGDTVHLTIDKGFWTDHFKDGTYSKLRVHWKTDCELEIEFIESNNVIRKNFSKPGDKYSYQVLNKGNGFYFMSAEIVGQNRFMTFKLYY